MSVPLDLPASSQVGVAGAEPVFDAATEVWSAPPPDETSPQAEIGATPRRPWAAAADAAVAIGRGSQNAGVATAGEKHHVPFLGELPLDTKIRRGGDEGIPIVVAEPDSEYATIFRTVCEKLAANIRANSTAQHARALRIE